MTFGNVRKHACPVLRTWHGLVVDVRMANKRALQHFRDARQKPYFYAWQDKAAEMREVSESGRVIGILTLLKWIRSVHYDFFPIGRLNNTVQCRWTQFKAQVAN